MAGCQKWKYSQRPIIKIQLDPIPPQKKNTAWGQNTQYSQRPKNKLQPEAKKQHTAGGQQTKYSWGQKKQNTAGGQQTKYSRRPKNKIQPEAKRINTAGGQKNKIQPEAKKQKTAGGQKPKHSRRKPNLRKTAWSANRKHNQAARPFIGKTAGQKNSRKPRITLPQIKLSWGQWQKYSKLD